MADAPSTSERPVPENAPALETEVAPPSSEIAVPDALIMLLPLKGALALFVVLGLKTS